MVSNLLLFVAQPFKKGKESVRIIRDTIGEGSLSATQLFKKSPRGYSFSNFSFTKSLEEADYVVVPQAVRRINLPVKRYLEAVKRGAQRAQKPVIVFLGKDDSHDIHIEGATVFVKSSYRRTIRPNEIQSVPFVEDLSESSPCAVRKKGARPVVSFCGYASFPSYATKVKYYVKNFFLDALSLILLAPHLRAYKRGIYFRRRSIALLAHHPHIATSFIIRTSYFGNKKTITKDPAVARHEYIVNMANSDFVLAPKGDANHSDRFFEALSLGRIPILIDTETVLPLENVIPYDTFIIRVPHTDLKNIAEYIIQRWRGLDDASYAAMQRAARQAFETYLRYDRFYSYVLPRLKHHG